MKYAYEVRCWPAVGIRQRPAVSLSDCRYELIYCIVSVNRDPLAGKRFHVYFNPFDNARNIDTQRETTSLPLSALSIFPVEDEYEGKRISHEQDNEEDVHVVDYKHSKKRAWNQYSKQKEQCGTLRSDHLQHPEDSNNLEYLIIVQLIQR